MKTSSIYENPSDTIASLHSSINGLGDEAVIALRKQWGPNTLPDAPRYSVAGLILAQFQDTMIFILLLSATLAGVLGEWVDSIIIFIIVLVNGVTGFIQAYNAERAIDAIRKMAANQAQVVRNGKVSYIDARELVPGDIVLLEAGNVVPADIRVLESAHITADESALTGESVAVLKTSQPLPPGEYAVQEMTNLLFKSTLIKSGRAKGIVIHTGIHTEIGTIATLLERKKSKTPLQQRMEDFSKKLSYIILAVCAILFAAGWLRGEEPLPMLLVAVSLAVAAIPEALPALVTIALARGASRLVRHNALIRYLPAVETLGSVNTICTDKTGTLTQNRMTVQHVHPVTEEERQLLYRAMVLNNDAVYQDGVVQGDPTETALISFLVTEKGNTFYDEQRKASPRIGEIGFTAERKCMSTIHQEKDGLYLYCKGAAEKITEKLIDTSARDDIHSLVTRWATEGLRVLAFAGKKIPDTTISLLDNDLLAEQAEDVEKDLVLYGFVGMMDPPRAEVSGAIGECREAGIRVIMITGDHPDTARAIASTIGLTEGPTQSVLEGKSIQHLSQHELQDALMTSCVVARVSPAQKLDIVNALQARGQFVAMTGDGVNDAPALKSSNIGVAMGISGTDVSKEAADMILMDDNFATIVRAVREGRRIFDNIRKFVRYIMTCNSAEILTLFFAPILGMPIPLLPVHILWINLVTDGLPGIALASEKEESTIMKRSPRPAGESLFAHGTAWHIVWVGSLMAIITLLTQYFAIQNNIAHWQTMVFAVLSFSQLGHVLAIRSESQFLFRMGLFSNRTMNIAVVVTVSLQLLVIYLPAANTFVKTQPLTLSELLWCLGASAVVFHAVEFEKWLRNRKKYSQG